MCVVLAGMLGVGAAWPPYRATLGMSCGVGGSPKQGWTLHTSGTTLQHVMTSDALDLAMTIWASGPGKSSPLALLTYPP